MGGGSGLIEQLRSGATMRHRQSAGVKLRVIKFANLYDDIICLGVTQTTDYNVNLETGLTGRDGSAITVLPGAASVSTRTGTTNQAPLIGFPWAEGTLHWISSSGDLDHHFRDTTVRLIDDDIVTVEMATTLGNSPDFSCTGCVQDGVYSYSTGASRDEIFTVFETTTTSDTSGERNWIISWTDGQTHAGSLLGYTYIPDNGTDIASLTLPVNGTAIFNGNPTLIWSAPGNTPDAIVVLIREDIEGADIWRSYLLPPESTNGIGGASTKWIIQGAHCPSVCAAWQGLTRGNSKIGAFWR